MPVSRRHLHLLTPQVGVQTLHLAPPPPGGIAPPAGQPETESGPDLLAAIQQQLGLKLESKKGPVDILVIDHAEKVPIEN